MNEQEKGLAVQAWDELKKLGDFDIAACDDIPNIDDNPKFRKLELTTGQKTQMAALATQLPAVVGAGVSGKAASIVNAEKLYLIWCPLGIENTFTRMKDGNYANFIRSGRFFDGYTPVSPVDISVPQAMAVQAAVMGAFSAMSIASGQYFLKQINNELGSIRQGTDKILEFLYGDKKAELISEVSFAKYAYENYNSIAKFDSQRAATIASLQQAKKVAMKDAEFYISDLGAALGESHDIQILVDKSCQISESLNLALQLAVMGAILEVYYSRNFDKKYLEYLERELSLYIEKCDKFQLAVFSKIHERVDAYKNLPPKKVDKEKLLQKVNAVVAPLQNSSENTLKKTLRDGLYSLSKNTSYYISKDGTVYIKEQ